MPTDILRNIKTQRLRKNVDTHKPRLGPTLGMTGTFMRTHIHVNLKDTLTLAHPESPELIHDREKEQHRYTQKHSREAAPSLLAW